jgi:hypothetical protein
MPRFTSDGLGDVDRRSVLKFLGVGGDAAAGTDLVQGWYDDQVVYYFLFEEAPLMPVDGMVPTSPIYVSFNVKPEPDGGGGPASGFMTEEDSNRTHNVPATLPDDDAYSPP